MIFTEFIKFSELRQNPKVALFLDVVLKKKFPLLPLGWCLLCVMSGNRYLPRGSTTTGNIFVARSVRPLVAIPFLD